VIRGSSFMVKLTAMEFDNDRKRRPASIFYGFTWMPVLLLYPLVNGLLLFPTSFWGWIILLVISLILTPGYVLYGRVVVYQQRSVLAYIYTTLLSLFAFSVVHGLLYLIYHLIHAMLPNPYFVYNAYAFLRESLWIVLNLGLSLVLTYLHYLEEQREGWTLAEKDNLFYKLRYLRAQLNPHFLFNTLNSIYSLSLQKSDKAPEVVIKLADLMRYLIYECNEERIPLDKEIDFIRNYIEIEKVRYRADIRFSVEGDTKDIMIEPFLFIAFVENGFKHAMDATTSEPFVYINLKVGKGRIILNVINSTNADLETQAKRIHGKGISQSKSLLELLYPGLYELDIIQTDKDPARFSDLRIAHARWRLEDLYPNAYDLDVILHKSAFTVSLILKTKIA
jgi:two-component system LytT family sensor kinase